jgi:glutamate-1-semialdehyde 2,1-aminomutase
VPTSYTAVTQSNIEQFKQFFHAMLNEGVYLAPSAYEAGFTSIAHDNAIIDEIVVATDKAMQTLK